MSSCRVPSSYSAGAGGGRAGAFSGSPSAKSCSFTVMMSAKSAASSSDTSKRSVSMLSFRTAIRSRIPVATKRSRATDTVSCGRPSTFALRRKNAAAKWSVRPEDRSSGREPASRRTRRERNRVS